MVVVDTSVWIEYFKGHSPSLVNGLNDALDEDMVLLPTPVWIELLSGASKRDQPRLRQLLSALPRVTPGKSTWKTIESWIPLATKKGRRFGLGDLLIAAVCVESHARLWSLDADFKEMSRLKFVKLF